MLIHNDILNGPRDPEQVDAYLYDGELFELKDEAFSAQLSKTLDKVFEFINSEEILKKISDDYEIRNEVFKALEHYKKNMEGWE